MTGEDANTANTSVLWHHGRLYARKEAGRPYELDPHTLETRGEVDFQGRLQSRTFTAHPKLDPLTGECLAFAYNCEGAASDEIELYTISPSGEFTRTERFKAPCCSIVDDFLVSRHYVIFVICPMVCDWDRVKKGEPYWHWDNQRKTHIAVIPRDQGVAAIHWFTAPKLAMQTHTFNAWEDGSRLYLDHFVNESGWLSQFPDIHSPNAHEMPPFGERWMANLSSQSDHVEIRRFIDHIGEMPLIDSRFGMRKLQHFWFGTNNPELGPMLPFGPKGPPFTCLGHFDVETGKLDLFYAAPIPPPRNPVSCRAGVVRLKATAGCFRS